MRQFPGSGMCNNLYCMKCRIAVDSRSGYCRSCGNSYIPIPDDSAALRRERAFMLDAAINLTDPLSPSMVGIPEQILASKAAKKPELPLGPPPGEDFSKLTYEQLLEKLDSEHPKEVALAAIHLGMLQAPGSTPKLLEALGTRNSDQRRCVLWSLGRSLNPSLLGPLVDYFHVEQDPLVKLRLSATLYSLLVNPGRRLATGSIATTELEKVEALTREIQETPTSELYFRRGLARLKSGGFIHALGDFTRAQDLSEEFSSRSMLFRSQAFLMLGKPLFAMDDLLLFPPLKDDLFPQYIIHKTTLIALARQIADGASARGLNDYAAMFRKKIDQLSTI